MPRQRHARRYTSSSRRRIDSVHLNGNRPIGGDVKTESRFDAIARRKRTGDRSETYRGRVPEVANGVRVPSGRAHAPAGSSPAPSADQTTADAYIVSTKLSGRGHRRSGPTAAVTPSNRRRTQLLTVERRRRGRWRRKSSAGRRTRTDLAAKSKDIPPAEHRETCYWPAWFPSPARRQELCESPHRSSSHLLAPDRRAATTIGSLCRATAHSNSSVWEKNDRSAI